MAAGRNNWDPTWFYAAAGSVGLHALVAGALLLPGTAWFERFRPGHWGAGLGQPVALSLLPGPETSLESGDVMPGEVLETQVQDRLARELESMQQLSEAQLQARLRKQRGVLGHIPTEHVGQITNVLEKLLPVTTYSVVTRTNDGGAREYVFSYTNSAGQREELLFDEEDHKDGGFLQLLEDPLLSPFMRYVLPLTEKINPPAVPPPSPPPKPVRP